MKNDIKSIDNSNILYCVSNLLSSENILCNIATKLLNDGKNGKIKNIVSIFSRNYTKINIVILHQNATHKTTYTLFNI